MRSEPYCCACGVESCRGGAGRKVAEMDNEQVRVCRCCGEAEVHADGCEEMLCADPLTDRRVVREHQKLEMSAGLAGLKRSAFADTQKHKIRDTPATLESPADVCRRMTGLPPADPWAHRSAGMRCRTCMWYVEKASDSAPLKRGLGRCRRHAPALQGFPVVFAEDWCGDHKLSEEAVR